MFATLRPSRYEAHSNGGPFAGRTIGARGGVIPTIALATGPRSQGTRRCAWAPCGEVLLPPATGGKSQKYHSSTCRELAKAAARSTCPNCGALLSRRGSA